MDGGCDLSLSHSKAYINVGMSLLTRVWAYQTLFAPPLNYVQYQHKFNGLKGGCLCIALKAT